MKLLAAMDMPPMESLERADVRDMIIGQDDMREVGEGIYYSPRKLAVTSDVVIEFLKHAARTKSIRRARFCAHPAPNADQHDMLIVSHSDTYVTPHRHLSKSESFVILEGFAQVILFDETGGVQEVFRMGPLSTGLPFFYRMPAKQFHSLSIESELLVFVESTKGPFDLADREHGSWAPHPDDSITGRAYIASILRDWYSRHVSTNDKSLPDRRSHGQRRL
jgi:cupin fold WbuC family metalloprotein